ncbi:MAG: 6-bladed beta-propeller [Betaproteobacteria bacterium RBG_16_56_24]|nr:MAG: 6-bladed beta-propeller [Betaproteobacteria bacterium RBG_16_56_24]
MTKRSPLLFLAIALVLGGCMMAMPDSKYGDKGSRQNELVFPLPPDEPRFYFERTIFSSADVRPDTASDKFRRALTGEQITGDGLAKPYSVAVHHGRVFVGDTVRRTVMVFDIPEQRFFTIGEEDPGGLVMPLGMDVDKQGNLYVVDAKLKKVQVYDRDGKYLRTLGETTQFHRPAGLAVDGDGRRVYVVDIGGVSTQEHRVRVLDGQSGALIFDIGTRGVKNGEFNLPRDAAIAPDGSVYIVDGGNFRVQKFTADGKFLSTFGSIGRQSGQFSRPKEIAIDSAGNIYVVDTAFGNFQIFNSDEKLLLAVGSRSNTLAPAKYSLPSGIAVDEDGRVYIVDQYFRKVDVFRPAGLAENEGFLVVRAPAGKTPPAAPPAGNATPAEKAPSEPNAP